MKISYAVIGLGLLCFGGVAGAAEAPQQTSNTEQAQSGQQQVADQSDKDEKKICKREEMTGSRVGAKICKTQKEWDEQAKGQGSDF